MKSLTRPFPVRDHKAPLTFSDPRPSGKLDPPTSFNTMPRDRLSPADVTIRPLLPADAPAARAATFTALDEVYPRDV
jgi:hypothetical protein